MQEYLEISSETIQSLSKSLEKAKELVRTFKLISIDQHLESIKNVYLKSYLEDILLSLNFKIKNTHITVTNHINDDININIISSSLFQIFSNLILNSVTHAFDPNKGGNIDIDAHCQEGLLTITYKDNGKGMDSKTLDHLFERFYTTKKESGGSGIGLYVVHDIIVNKLHGSIDVTSQEGKGSDFTIKIPDCK